MANTAIPLSVQQVDVVNPLLFAAQLGQQKRQAEAQNLQLEGQKQQNAASKFQNQREVMRVLASDGIALDKLVQAGDMQAAAILGQEIKRNMTDFQIPTNEIDKLLSTFGQPEMAKRASAEMVQRIQAQLPQIFGEVVPQSAVSESGQVITRGQDGNFSAQQVSGFQAPPPDAQANAQQFGGQIQVKDQAGNLFFATTARDPASGQVKTILAPIGNAPAQPQGGVSIVGQFGETGAENMGRKVEEAAATTTAKQGEERAGALIDRGIAAAESTAAVRRAISLLDLVETGGPQAFMLAAKQRLGLEGADEGELSNALGVSVLSQLRETFGAAFTEGEGQRLERIQANFGKSSATNKRLLQQALRIAENTARRGMEAARARGQTEAVTDIEELLNFSLDDPPSGQPAQSGQTGSFQSGRFQVEVVQ
jgi:hypothetical protein